VKENCTRSQVPQRTVTAWEKKEEEEEEEEAEEGRTLTPTVLWDVTPCIIDVSGEPAASILGV
jgi:hypothetical protein